MFFGSNWSLRTRRCDAGGRVCGRTVDRWDQHRAGHCAVVDAVCSSSDSVMTVGTSIDGRSPL